MSRRAWLGTLATLAASAALAAGVVELVRRGELAVDWGTERYELLAPEMLWLVVLVPFLAWALGRSLADLPRLQRALGLLVRSLLIVLLALALARVARTTDATKVSTIFLVDVSDSVPDVALTEAHAVIERTWRARGDNDVRVVTFARDARAVAIARDATTLPPIARHLEPRGAGAGTDLASALRLAYGLYPPGHLKRAVFLTDGIETDEDVLAEASRAARFAVRVSYEVLRQGVPHEVAVRDLSLPDRVQVGEPFFVRARVFATAPTHARVRLYQGETLNGLDSIREVELARGETELEFRSVVRLPGAIAYRLEIDPAGADRFPENNRFTRAAVVPGRPAVLVVDSDPSRATYLARALGANDFEVDVRSPREMPTDARSLERFDFFVLSNVPADQVSLGAQDAIERWVRDSGGGFLMAGGDQSFGLGGWQGTRMEQMLPVRLDAERRRDQPSLALALVIDKSGSMSGQKIELAKDAAKATAELLGPDDFIGVIGYDSEPTRVVRMQSASNRLQIISNIGRLAASGGTAIFPALDMAFQDLSVTRARVKHVILLTDGQTQETGLPDLVTAMRAEGITVSVVGLGADVNRSLLTALASAGGGRSYFTNDPHNVPRIFTRETTTVARSSAVEEYFQASVVERADFLRGIDVGTAPFLHGYVATKARSAPAQVILASELGEPVLARWRVGLGWSLAWTSDIKNRWAVEWLRWPGFVPFWAGLVREHQRTRRRQTLPMTAELAGEQARVAVDAIGQDDRFVDDLDSQVVIEGPLGARAADRLHEEHTLEQVAPGRYEARFALDRFGTFVLTATHRRDGRAVYESATSLVNPYPREYATLEPDEARLARVATLTRGRRGPTPAQLFDPGGEKIRAREELWPKLVLAALVLFLFDLLLRRVRIFDRKFRRPASRASNP